MYTVCTYLLSSCNLNFIWKGYSVLLHMVVATIVFSKMLIYFLFFPIELLLKIIAEFYQLPFQHLLI